MINYNIKDIKNKIDYKIKIDWKNSIISLQDVSIGVFEFDFNNSYEELKEIKNNKIEVIKWIAEDFKRLLTEFAEDIENEKEDIAILSLRSIENITGIIKDLIIWIMKFEKAK